MMDLLFAIARVGFLTKHRGDVKLRNRLKNNVVVVVVFISSLRVIVKKLEIIDLRLYLQTLNYNYDLRHVTRRK